MSIRWLIHKQVANLAKGARPQASHDSIASGSNTQRRFLAKMEGDEFSTEIIA